MKLIKWSLLFDISVESPIVTIWISFPELQPHFSPIILFRLGSLFGWPLQIYNAIVVGSRPSIIRVLVELDITKHYPNSILLGPQKFSYVQKVIMNDFPTFCDHCKTLGHFKDEWFHLNPTLKKNVLFKPKSIIDITTPALPVQCCLSKELMWTAAETNTIQVDLACPLQNDEFLNIGTENVTDSHNKRLLKVNLVPLI